MSSKSVTIWRIYQLVASIRASGCCAVGPVWGKPPIARASTGAYPWTISTQRKAPFLMRRSTMSS